MNWMTKIKIIAKKILRCLMVGGICSIFEKVIAAIGIFDVFDKDLYCFTIDNVLLGIALVKYCS